MNLEEFRKALSSDATEENAQLKRQLSDHHWQYWVLINDEPKEGTILIEMPCPYIIEMIRDWWAFSWIKGDLTEMFTWYKDHADYIKMHNNTRSIVEEILEMIRTKLAEVENAEN